MICQNDPELFFDPAREDEAKDACSFCPLMEQCKILGEAEEYGVWGGIGPVERALARFRKAGDKTEARQNAFDVLVEVLADRGITGILGIAKATGLRYTVVAQRMGVDVEDPRGSQVVNLRASGMSTRAVARQLGIGESTVRDIEKRVRQAAA
ncbi:hypothetical protein M2302_002268 [Micromonospora sp. A200]|uniref:WhiB family transcriptional regulator n=1 Tax=Micromonospora sp. A200 TaxID=2940568 RepID=UPI002476FB9E|nr:WhiB family transcriptional regulator [Micromonospora sp. A200]MDH6462093.1 hypothetical protein [Micromonospora sp. A200]